MSHFSYRPLWFFSKLVQFIDHFFFSCHDDPKCKFVDNKNSIRKVSQGKIILKSQQFEIRHLSSFAYLQRRRYILLFFEKMEKNVLQEFLEKHCLCGTISIFYVFSLIYIVRCSAQHLNAQEHIVRT